MVEGPLTSSSSGLSVTYNTHSEVQVWSLHNLVICLDKSIPNKQNICHGLQDTEPRSDIFLPFCCDNIRRGRGRRWGQKCAKRRGCFLSSDVFCPKRGQRFPWKELSWGKEIRFTSANRDGHGGGGGALIGLLHCRYFHKLCCVTPKENKRAQS